MRKAVIELTSEIQNDENESVVTMAVKRGAAPIVDELFNLENIYRFDEDDIVKYDVTHLIPDTFHRIR